MKHTNEKDCYIACVPINNNIAYTSLNIYVYEHIFITHYPTTAKENNYALHIKILMQREIQSSCFAYLKWTSPLSIY